MACRLQMPTTVNAGDWLAEIDQVSGSHALSTLVHLNAQPEPNPVIDIQPVQKHDAGNLSVLDRTCRSLMRLGQLH